MPEFRTTLVAGVTPLVVAALMGGGAAVAQAESNSNKRVDLSRLVVVGDSLSAGFQNFSLFDSDSVPNTPPGGQKHGYAALIADQAQVNLPAPLITLPGVPPTLMLTPSGEIVRGTSTGTREDPAQQVHNLSVPGFSLADMFAHPFPGNPQNPIDAMSDLIMALPGNAVPGCGPIPAHSLPPMTPPSTLGVSEVACAAALKPTTILVSAGSNDALQSLTFGLAPTEPGVFAVEYALLLGKLSSTGAALVVSNIPNVTDIPFLVPVPAFKAMCPAGTPLPFNITNADFVVPNIVDPTATSFNICTNYAVRSAALVRQTRSAIAAYNVIIAIEAPLFGAAVVDVNRLFAGITQSGYEVGGRKLTTAFLGGIFSLDGIHPTNTGYAILANETIKTMNRQFHSTIPPVSVEQIAATDPLVFPVH